MGAEPASYCAVFHRAVELIGRRWNGAIIQALLGGASRFTTIRDAVPDLTDKMLSDRLKELEAERIVARVVIPTTPVRVEYGLTPKGQALADALSALGEWAHRWAEPADQTADGSALEASAIDR
jgi:DNA-binding HxlR family transcriptional regulator